MLTLSRQQQLDRGFDKQIAKRKKGAGKLSADFGGWYRCFWRWNLLYAIPHLHDVMSLKQSLSETPRESLRKSKKENMGMFDRTIIPACCLEDAWGRSLLKGVRSVRCRGDEVEFEKCLAMRDRSDVALGLIVN